MLWDWILVHHCCFAKKKKKKKGGCYVMPGRQQSFTCKCRGAVILDGKKEAASSPHTVSSGITNNNMLFLPFASPHAWAQNKSNLIREPIPWWWWGWGTVQSRYLIVPLGTEIGKWWLSAHQVTALQCIVTGLANTENQHKQHPTITLKKHHTSSPRKLRLHNTELFS